MLIHNVLPTELTELHYKSQNNWSPISKVERIYLHIKRYMFFCTVSLLNVFKIHVLRSAYDTILYKLEMLSTNNFVNI